MSSTPALTREIDDCVCTFYCSLGAGGLALERRCLFSPARAVQIGPARDANKVCRRYLQNREFAEIGGLMSYGTNFPDAVAA